MINVTKPTIILDKEKCLANLQRMFDKASKSKVHFRPHFKTHQSAIIGNWMRRLGIHPITVSSVSMAKYFSNYGWKDITISTPANILEASEINELAIGVRLNILVESPDPLKYLDPYLTYPVGIFIEIDTGYPRSGIDWEDSKAIDEILQFIAGASKITFKGFLTHSGQTYHAENTETIKDIYKDTLLKMNYLKKQYVSDWPDLIISVGDTPACSIVDDLGDVDEIRPGNFIFYDLMQYSIGACQVKDIAIALACPVIAKNPRRNEIVLYGGSAHLSKEFLFKSNGDRIYGYVVKFDKNSWSDPLKGTYLANITQEHGIIKTTAKLLEEIKRGDILGILPVHSCLTANLMRKYQTLDGNDIDY